jgi:hypothetical protein
VTVQTPPWWPTSVSPLSSWAVNTSGRVVRRIGAGEGSAGAGSGQLWISAHDVAKLHRVPAG